MKVVQQVTRQCFRIPIDFWRYCTAGQNQIAMAARRLLLIIDETPFGIPPLFVVLNDVDYDVKP